MSEKRYFKIEYDEEWYLFDSTTISEQLVKEQAEYGYGVFANSLSPSEVVDLLNRQQTSIETMLENMEKLEKENKELGKNFDDIVKWASEIAKRNVVLDEKIGRLQQEEKLYAQEILRLNTLLKQYQANQDLGGGY